MATVGIKFLYNFAVGEYDLDNPGSNVISVTSTAAGDFDKKNLTTTPLRELWRSGSNIASTQEIVIKTNDESVIPDVFAILNHNFTSLAVVQLQGSMTTSFVGAAVIPFTWTKKNMVLLQSPGAAYKYYKFSILDPSNGCGFIECGRIVAGKSFTMTENEDITDSIQVAPQDLASKTKTEGFFRASNERVKIDKVAVRFEKLQTVAPDNINYLGLQTMFNSVGETFPFLTIVDPEDQAFQITWGMIENLPSRGFTINRYVDMSLSIEEVY